MKIAHKLCCLALAAWTAAASAGGDPEAGKAKAAACAGCHGPDGNSTVAQFPKLAGQNERYLLDQLKAFKSGKRDNAIMAGQVAALSEQDMADLAAYYAAQQTTPAAANPEYAIRGEEIYRGGITASDVPSCMGCHGPDGAGNPAAGFPSLAGQHAEYIETQLLLYRDGKRKSDPAAMMRNIAERLTVDDIKAVSGFIPGLHLNERAVR